MNIENRKLEADRRFQEKKAEREQHLQLAEDCLVEMTKLQGEFRLLEELEADKPKPSVNKKATVIEAVPEPVEAK